MAKGTIFFVHGAGNRDDQASTYEAALRLGFFGPHATPAQTAKLKRSTWGGKRGPDAALLRLDAALPEVVSGNVGLAAIPDLADPLAPLRALSAGPDANAFSAGSADARQLLAILQAGFVDLSDIGLSSEAIVSAASSVAASTEYAAATGTSEDVFDATLQSVVAVAIAREGAGAFGVGDIGGAIAAAAGSIAKSLLGSGVASAVGSWLGTNLGPAAKLALSKRLAQERGPLMHKQILVPADVLYYQRNGEAIRSWVRDEIGDLEPPVVALGHSLGGIILVDTLFTPGAAKTSVELLVTFGSQSAFLQSFGALGSLTPNLPWINIWTRYDFASFLAGAFWPGLVQDMEVPIEVGFPDAHGAYFDALRFYEEIKAQSVVQGILG